MAVGVWIGKECGIRIRREELKRTMKVGTKCVEIIYEEISYITVINN